MSDPKTARGRFSATDAAFTGFRLMAREPGTVAVWGAIYLAFTLVFAVGTVLMIGPSMSALMAQQHAGAAADPAASLAMMSRLLPFEGVALIAGLLFYALMFTAVNRAVLRPGAGGPGRLALGGDEGRQLLLFVILGVLFFVAYIVLVIVAAIVGVVLGIAVAGGAHAAPGSAPGPVIAVGLVMVLAVLLILGVLATRLSLASPLTFDTDRIDVFGSWRLTRGVFWPLFGAYVMTWLLGVLMYVAALVLFSVIAAATGGGLAAAGVVFRPDMSSLGAYFAPTMLLWIAMVTVVGTVVLVMLLAAPAGAYAQLKALGLITPLAPPGPTPAAPAVASDLPKFGR